MIEGHQHVHQLPAAFVGKQTDDGSIALDRVVNSKPGQEAPDYGASLVQAKSVMEHVRRSGFVAAAGRQGLRDLVAYPDGKLAELVQQRRDARHQTARRYESMNHSLDYERHVGLGGPVNVDGPHDSRQPVGDA